MQQEELINKLNALDQEYRGVDKELDKLKKEVEKKEKTLDKISDKMSKLTEKLRVVQFKELKLKVGEIWYKQSEDSMTVYQIQEIGDDCITCRLWYCSEDNGLFRTQCGLNFDRAAFVACAMSGDLKKSCDGNAIVDVCVKINNVMGKFGLSA